MKILVETLRVFVVLVILSMGIVGIAWAIAPVNQATGSGFD